MASGTMVSRILGFVRNAMLIATVGATAGGVTIQPIAFLWQ